MELVLFFKFSQLYVNNAQMAIAIKNEKFLPICWLNIHTNYKLYSC